MAINKVVNKSTKSHGAMRNVLEYVLRNEKIKEGFVEITGPNAADTINYDEIYQSWLAEKRLWDKDSGRMYAHNLISFHKDETVTPGDGLEIGKQFADKFFDGFQYVIGVHQDKEHLHCHIVTNSVSFIDGHKLHQTKRDLNRQKEYTNNLCLEYGLTIAEKGHHFDGSPIEEGHITSWCKDKYNLLANDSKKSFVADCAIAIMESVPGSSNRDEFISHMEERGWSVQWEDNRKHILFQNESGNKVRDSNIEKTFAMDINKESLFHEFERQNELRIAKFRSEHDQADSNLRKYYAEIDAAISGTGTAEGAIGNDTETFIRELRSKERAAEQKRDHSISERADRETERERSRIKAERAAEKTERTAAPERTERQERSLSFHLSR